MIVIKLLLRRFKRVNDKSQQVYLESKLKNNLSGSLSLEEFFSPSFGTKSEILKVLVVRLDCYCNSVTTDSSTGESKGL